MIRHWSQTEKLFPWYDSGWLSAFETARRRLSELAPARLTEFERAFAPLRTRADFKVRELEMPLSEPDLEKLRAAARALSVERLEKHELEAFGRFVAHDLPEVSEVHRRVCALVSDLAGEALEPSYNFLSLYHEGGILPPHLDDPLAKWTLDICLSSSVDWPIYISEVTPWPRAGDLFTQEWQEHVKAGHRFTAHSLRPGQGILFSGSSQWHYRNSLPKVKSGDFCDLAFFHFRPAGSSALTDPAQWPDLFGIPELLAP